MPIAKTVNCGWRPGSAFCFLETSGRPAPDAATNPTLIDSLVERLAKIEKLLEERGLHGGPATFTVKMDSLTVTTATGETESLTAKEMQIVSLLADSAQRTMKRSDLIKSVWRSVNVSAKTLDVHIHNLRKKLKPAGLSIVFLQPHSFMLIGSLPATQSAGELNEVPIRIKVENNFTVSPSERLAHSFFVALERRTLKVGFHHPCERYALRKG